MADKMLCPGCNAYSSSVLAKVAEGEACPFCGLDAATILKVHDVRRKQADEDLKRRLEESLIEQDRLRARTAEMERIVERVRRALSDTT